MEIIPLSPYQHEFPGHYGASRSDYFLTSPGDWRDAGYRARLDEMLRKTAGDTPKNVDLYSLYLYKKTASLNETFSGDADALRGVHDEDLISYVRWLRGDLDIFYLIENGDVVYDLLANEPVTPPWEFD